MIRWNSWNRFSCDINETLIKETGIYIYIYTLLLLLLLILLLIFIFICNAADAIVSTGLAKLGYQYVNLGIYNMAYWHACFFSFLKEQKFNRLRF